MNGLAKFRGKSVKTGEFVEGNLITYIESGDELVHYIVSLDGYTRVAVDPATIGKPIGLNDKNGKEIFESDLLRIKHRIGDNPNYYVDAIYRVDKLDYKGVSLYCVKPVMSEDTNNQYPIHSILSFQNDSLCVDYRERQYDRICIEDTSGSNHHLGTVWKQNYYSNDIEVVGNTFDNPELFNTEQL